MASAGIFEELELEGKLEPRFRYHADSSHDVFDRAIRTETGYPREAPEGRSRFQEIVFECHAKITLAPRVSTISSAGQRSHTLPVKCPASKAKTGNQVTKAYLTDKLFGRTKANRVPETPF
jgi:hypothetical protein